MAAFIKENTQFVGTDGKPLSNGLLYIGINGSDPVANPLSIFSDRELTIALANPQTLNTFGESTNKIWIEGKYSIQVNNSAGTQKFQDLDAGEVASAGVTTLTNTQGTNTITAEAASTITEYVDKEIYILQLANAPTGAVTVNFDSVGAKSVVKKGGNAIVASEHVANQTWMLAFNETNDNFELQTSTTNIQSAQLNVGQQFTRAQGFNATTLTSTSNAVAWNAASNQVVTHVLTENTTFSAPTNLANGTFYNLKIVQDASASAFTVAFDSVFNFVGGVAPTWTTTANAVDFITFRSNGTKMFHVGHALDLS